MVDPATASSSITLIAPASGYAPGCRTSPTMKTFRLWYSATVTLTRGFLK